MVLVVRPIVYVNSPTGIKVLICKHDQQFKMAEETIYLCNFRVSVDGDWLCLKELSDVQLEMDDLELVSPEDGKGGDLVTGQPSPQINRFREIGGGGLLQTCMHNFVFGNRD